LSDPRPWVFCQLGAREHYILPRAFERRGRLAALVTEAWVPPHAIAARIPGSLGRRFADRFAPDLAASRVEAFTGAAIAFELGVRLRREAPAAWPTILRRNAWFERHAVARLQRARLLDERPVVFAYSYAALGILQAAKAAGCTTVLGQIDPAISEEDVVAGAVTRHAALQPDWHRAPPQYWVRWREECALADHIVVNSPWARDGLVKAGIDSTKLAVVPLAYEARPMLARRPMPDRFSAARPLRVLFLGSLGIRKGIAEVLEAASLLADAPVEFHLVGQSGIVFPADIVANPKVRRHGSVSRGAAAGHYAAADVFVLPSHSDGFGLTQIEAQAHGLPLIASRHCGAVVRDGVDGFLLDGVTASDIAAAVTRYLADPSLLAIQSAEAAASVARFDPAVIGDRLAALVD